MINDANASTREKIRKELGNVEIDALYTYKGHYNAADRWKLVHGLLGWSSALLAGGSGLSGLRNEPVVAIILAFVAAAVAGATAVFSPKESFARHYASAGQFKEIHARVRVERTIKLDQIDEATATTRLEEIMTRYHNLNQQSPPVPSWAYEKTRKGIERGEHVYDQDKELSQ